MNSKPSMTEIATDRELWKQYVDPSNNDPEAFDRMTDEEKIQLQRELWPEEADPNEDRAYWVYITKREGEEPESVGPFDTVAEAIKEARSQAWDNDDAMVVVDDDLGDEHWNNEGDWRNAVR